MKNKINSILAITLYFVSFNACANAQQKNKNNTSSQTYKVSKPVVKNPNASIKKQTTAQTNFSGSYSTTINGTTMSITLLSKGIDLTGNFVMNGQQAKIYGVIKNLTASGKIIEDESGKSYIFEAIKKGEELNFKFVVPEQQNQTVDLWLKKEVKSSSTPNSGRAKNTLLYGTWRHTEVISSGSGQFYSSFSTDYFLKFKSDGTAQVWTGKSAGGTNGVTIDSAKPGSIQHLEWYTEGKLLYFINPNTKEKSSISCYVEPNRMLLTSGNNKKVYHKLN